MRPTSALLTLLFAATAAAPALAQEPVVAAADPEALFTDKDPGSKYTSISYDQWRIVDGRADEHWDTATLDPKR